jgi:hypothetical protein
MAGSIKITDFKSRISDVARPNRFFMSVVGNGLPAGNWQDDMSYMCKSVSLPSRTIGNIELNWQGMKAKIAGDPTFEDITLTFINEYSWRAKNFFETWIETISNMASNNRTAHGNYKCQIQLEQLGRSDADILAVYVLDGAFPVSMDAIELSQESNDTAMEFSVTLAYDIYKRNDISGISPTLD